MPWRRVVTIASSLPMTERIFAGDCNPPRFSTSRRVSTGITATSLAATSRRSDSLAEACRSRSPYSGCAWISVNPTTGSPEEPARSARSGWRASVAVPFQQEVEGVPDVEGLEHREVDPDLPARPEALQEASYWLPVAERAAHKDHVRVSIGVDFAPLTPPANGEPSATSYGHPASESQPHMTSRTIRSPAVAPMPSKANQPATSALMMAASSATRAVVPDHQRTSARYRVRRWCA